MISTEVKEQVTSVSKEEKEPSSECSLKKQFMPNLISNGGIFLLNIVIGLWYAPYLIRNLGVAAYGLVPLANSLTSYLSLVSLSINGAAGRFLTLDLKKGNFSSANRTFNTTLVGNLALVALILPFVWGLVLIAPRWIDIPLGQERNAQWLLAATLVSYLVTIIQSSFSVSSWACNRFDLRNAVIAVHHLAQAGIVVASFALVHPTLGHVGLSIFGAALIGFAGDVWLWRKLTPQLRVQLSGFDRSRVRQLFGMGGWLIINQVGTLLFLRVDLIVANVLLGAEIAGGYGSVLLFSTMLRRLAQTVSSALNPTIMTKYARGDIQAVNRISQQAVKLLGLAMALPIGLLCGFAAPLLTLWLGPEFTNLSWLLVVSVGHLSVNLAVLPLFGINTALNRVQVPGIVTLAMGLANLGLAVGFVKLGWGAAGIAVAGAIVLTAKNAFFTPIYAAHIQKLPWWTFLTAMLPASIGNVVVTGLTYGVAKFALIRPNWLALGGISALISAIYTGVLYFGILNSEDRVLLRSLLGLRRLQQVLGVD